MGFVVVAHWVAKQGEADRVRTILQDVTPGNRAEPKMLEFRAQESIDEPGTFVLYEHYTDESGYADHRATDAFQQRVLGEAVPLLADRSVRTYRTFTD